MNIEEIDSVYKLNKFLKSNGDINTPTKEGNLLLTLLSKKNENEKLLNEIIKKGIDVNKLTSFNRNALFFEMKSSTANLLIKNGINIKQKDKENLSPLFFYHSSNVMELLIKNGCDPLHVDSKNRTFAHDYKFSNVLRKSSSPRKSELEEQKEYINRLEVVLKYIPSTIIDDQNFSINNYISWLNFTPDDIMDLINLHIKYDYPLNFEKPFYSFAMLSNLQKDASFLLGEVLIEKMPDYLRKSIDNDFLKYKEMMKIESSDSSGLQKFKRMFIEEIIIKKEKETIIKSLKDNKQIEHRKRRI